MTLGQAALKWVLAEPTVTSAQPNIYDLEQLEEFAAAADLPDLTPTTCARSPSSTPATSTCSRPPSSGAAGLWYRFRVARGLVPRWY